MNEHPFLPALSLPLVLASQSPRRQELLRAQGLSFTVAPAGIDETVEPGESPVEHVRRLSVQKAAAVGQAHPGHVVLGGDTVVVIDDEILGKPRDEAEARAMLARLSGRVHEVASGVALVADSLEVADHDRTQVRFRELTATEIASYVATGEPLDKAGAYGIQAVGALLVAEIEGCYFNVMGLPLQALRRAMFEIERRLTGRARSAKD